MFYQHDKETYDEAEIEPQVDQLWVAVTGRTIQQAFGVPLLPGFVSYHDGRASTEKEIAGFAEASFNITEQLKVTGGVRASKAEFNFSEFSEGPFGVGGNLLPVTSAGSSVDHPLTPKANISYTTDTGLYYATAAKGYRIGGANAVLPNICAAQLASLGVSGTAPPYSSDSVWSYEVGAKQRFAENRAELQASAFKIDWQGIQGVIPLNTCALSYTGNFGKATSRGFDLQGQFRLTQDFTLEGSMSYTDAHYTETVSVPNSTTQLLAKSGDPLLNTPKWQGHAGAQYNWMMFGSYDAYARADFKYIGGVKRTYSSGVNGFIGLIRDGSSYTNTSMRAGVRKDGIDVSVFIDNLTNDETPVFSTVNNNGGFAATAPAIRNLSQKPRTGGMTVTYHY